MYCITILTARSCNDQINFSTY